MPTFGDTTAGTDTFPGNSDRALLDRATLTESATLSLSWHYVGADSTSGANWKGLIFSDSSGPSARQAVSAVIAASPASTWVSGSISGSLSAANYWIGSVADNYQASLGEDATGSAPDVVMANGSFSYASPPATWPGTDASYGVGLNTYVEYTAGGGGGATSLLLPSRSARLLPYLLFRNALKERFSRFRLPPPGLDILVEHFRARGLLSNRGAFAR